MLVNYCLALSLPEASAQSVVFCGRLGWRQNQYHRVLSRAKWSARQCSLLLLQLLLRRFQADEKALVFVIDETLKRRWRPHIKVRGIYRDARCGLPKATLSNAAG